MFSKYNEEAKKILINMQKEMSLLKHPYIGSEHLFLSILKYANKNIKYKLSNYGLTYDSFKNELIKVVGFGKKESEYYLYTPLLRSILESSAIISSDSNKSEIDTSDLLFSIFEEGEGVAIRIIIGMNIDIDKIYDDFSVFDTNVKNNKLCVDEYGVDLCAKAIDNCFDPVIGRDNEIKRIIEILTRRTKNNPLLVGEAGVGKTAIVEELARLISTSNVPDKLKNSRIISISMSNLVAGTKYRGEFEERFEKILKEIENNSNIILFIDEVHTLVGAGGAEGAIDASNILKPALARGKIKLIGATTTLEYKKTIAKDKALARRFQIVSIDEPSCDETFNILVKLRPIYEKYHKVKFSDEILKTIVNLSDRYLYDKKMPDKAIDVMDEVASKISLLDKKKVNLSDISDDIIKIKNEKNNAIINDDFNSAILLRKKEMSLISKKNKMELKSLSNDCYKIITIFDVRLVIKSMSKVPFFTFDNNDLDIIKKHLKSSVIGQNEAIEKIYQITKKIRYGVKKNNRPFSALFVGPSGVGKTLLAKEYAKNCYNNNIIRLDMSEYKEEHTISKIIGSPPGYVGYDDNKNVFSIVNDNPYSVILLDEVEQANKNVLNIFLQILDEGYAKDSSGNIVNFSNAFFIMTSNIGYTNSNIGFNNFNNNILNNYFSVPFLNRINEIIRFNRLDKETISLIINKKINALRDSYRNISIRLSKNVIEKIVYLCQYNIYGARKVDFVISDYIENLILNALIEGKNKIYIKDIDNNKYCKIC